jgi:DNA invertase Pin-like site-specific DNA recombinase
MGKKADSRRSKVVRISTKAVGYVRVSGQGQVDGHGFERQEQAIRAFARSRGFDLIRVYQETHTGTDAERPAFAELLADLLANGCRVVVVESLDRLARDLMVQVALLGRLRDAGITLYSATTGEDVTASIAEDPMREALVLVQGVFAQTEKKLLVRKLRKAREAIRAREGRCEGRKPYGPEVVETLRTLRRKHGGKRLSWSGCAARLQELGLPTKSGKPWRAGTLHGLARREGIL